MTPTAAAEPAVLPFRPRAGWQAAGPVRRVLAVLCALLTAGWLASLGTSWSETYATTQGDPSPGYLLGSGLATAAALLLAPPACWAVARVLRPYPPGTGAERRARHACAALATAYGVPLTPWLVGLESGFVAQVGDYWWAYAPVPVLLGPLTLAWGCLAALVRTTAAAHRAQPV